MTTTVGKGSGRAAAAARRKKAAQREVASVKPDPKAWRAALELAGGDARRLVTLKSGSVLVANAARRSDPNATKW